ncbi:MAG: hypothetical protein U0270_28695 [Labilithrix sp.]
MRKPTTSLYLPVAFLGATTLAACSFQIGGDPKQPNQPANRPAQPAAQQPQPAQPAQPAQPQKPVHRTGKARGPSPTPSSSQTVNPPPPPPPAPAGAPIVNAPTLFGGPTVDAAGLKGNIYWIPAGTTKLPDLSKMTPNGYLFTNTLNVSAQNFSTGFPGVDPARSENFAIHYEGPLVVGTESDYDFRLVADDGAQLRIDATQASAGSAPIVDNDGVHAKESSVTGPVHLVVGTHLLVVDYFQAAGNRVALQLFCTKAGGTEQVCPTKLP